MILVIQYKDSDGEYLNYSALELNNLEKVAVKLREAIDLSAEKNYSVGYIYLEFYKDGVSVDEPLQLCHKYVHTAITSIMRVLEKHP